MRQYTQTIIEDLCDKGYIPIACVDMQASIYVLHISYEAPDDDPFYELDKFIVKLTQHTSQLDIAYLSNLVGLETSFIRYRFQKLKKEHNMSFIIVTHDFKLLSAFIDRAYVLHKGKIVEEGFTQEV